jgi:hypothetical protein
MQIWYGNIQSKFVYNWLAPANVMAWHHWTNETQKKNWWKEDVITLRNKGQNLFISLFDKATGHFTDLKNSISKKGIIDPIKCITGIPYDALGEHRYPTTTLPDSVNPNRIVHSHIFGGSRLLIAQQLGITNIPCIIYDTEENSWIKEIDTENLLEKVSIKELKNFIPKTYCITQYNHIPMPVIRVKEIDYHQPIQNIQEKPKWQKPVRTEITCEVARLLNGTKI